MKKRDRYGTIAALTLGLCLVATYAFAVDYDLINSSGGTIQAKCVNGNYSDVANGATSSFDCSKGVSPNSGNLVVRAAGATQTYNTPISALAVR